MATEKIAYKLRINVGGDKTSETQNLSPGKTARIKAQAGVRYQLQDANKNDAPPEQVRVKRVGKDLHVALGEGEEAAQLIIEDYYGVMPEGFNALVGQAEGGSFYEYVLEAPTTDSYTLSLAEGQDFTSAVLGGSEVSGSGAALAVLAFNPLLAAGAAAGAAGAAAGGGGTTAPAATVDTTPPAAPGLKVDDRDANGKINASGTAAEPIIFTAEADNLNGNLGQSDRGLWGGVVILGRARINTAAGTPCLYPISAASNSGTTVPLASLLPYGLASVRVPEAVQVGLAALAGLENGQRLPLDIQVGDKVIYSKYGGTEVKYNNEEYLILSARDVLAVVEK